MDRHDAPRREAERILHLVDGNAHKGFEILERQLSVLVLRSQVMLSLSGIVITVTGFSGRAVAASGALARIAIVSGMSLVLLAAAVAIGGVLRLRWLTEELSEDPVETLVRAIGIRRRRSRHLSLALVLFVVGFALYCLAVAQLLARPSSTG